jgi:SHS2 domain-containing protein
MPRKKRFEFLEHTADAYIAAYGKDLIEAFENAAVAMFDVMTQIEKVRPEALLVKSELTRMLFSKFMISELVQDSKGFRLAAGICGEKFDPKKHLQKVGVKAVTYHRMEIIKTVGKVTLKFILDI